jgi:predicted nuclease of restriction endonuclease-like (RecB) superfamily
LAKHLRKDFGSGYSESSLWNYRQFYTTFPILSAVRRELTWTHYRLLMRVENANAREFYEDECIKNNWSTRALERQIHVFYYERMLASRDREALSKEAEEKTAPLPISPRDFIKDPYILEFLEVKPDHRIYESDLEQLIMDNLQQLLTKR